MSTAPCAEPTHNYTATIFSAQYGATKSAPYSFGIALFPGPALLLITCLPYRNGKLGGTWEQDTWLVGNSQVTYLCVLPCEGEGVWSSLEK